MITAIIFILVLSLLVFVHELGHFLTARRLGVKAEEFGFGFPPRLIGYYKDSEGKWHIIKGNKEVVAPGTIYSINALPLGGFVKIKGENGDSTDTDSFSGQELWRRALILFAGVFMNIVLAGVLFSIGFGIGLPASLDGAEITGNMHISDRQARVVSVFKESPAEIAGLKAGDAILTISAQPIFNAGDIQNILKSSSTKPVTVTYRRAGVEYQTNASPSFSQDLNRSVLGVEISEIGTVRYPWYLTPWYGFKAAILMLVAIFVAFYQLIAGLFAGHGAGDAVGGPVKIAQMTGEAARFGFAYLINFVALLSLNLAVINILPLPALDGGRLLFLLIERIKGSPVKKEAEAIVHTVGFWLLILLMILVTYKDIFR
ncbi:MAG: RIP metalloprotease RseP [Patescibacteria group bacterium]